MKLCDFRECMSILVWLYAQSTNFIFQLSPKMVRLIQTARKTRGGLGYDFGCGFAQVELRVQTGVSVEGDLYLMWWLENFESYESSVGIVGSDSS